MKKIEVEQWQLVDIHNTLRLVANTFNCKDRDTCLKRNVMKSYHFITDIINGKPYDPKESISNYMSEGKEPDDIKTAAVASPQEQKTIGWISVDVQLPPKEEIFLVYAYPRMRLGAYNDDDERCIDSGTAWIPSEIEYWMPILELPSNPFQNGNS